MPSSTDRMQAGFAADEGLATSMRWTAGIGVAVLVVLGALIVAGYIDLAAIAEAAAAIPPAVLAAVLALSLVSYALRGLRWHALTLQVTGNVTARQSLLYYLTGFAFLLTPAKIGEVVRLWLLKSRHDVAYTRSIGLMVLDRAVDMVCLVAFAGIGLVGRTEHAGALPLLLLSLAAVIGLLSSRVVVVGAVRLAHRASGRRWPGMMRFALHSYRTLRTLCRPRVLMIAILLGLAAWGAQIAGTWLLLDALGVRTDLATCAFIFSFAVLVGVVPLFPGGVGGAEAAMVGLLVLIGVPTTIAVTATVLSRLATLWLALLVGFAVAPLTLAGGRGPAAAGIVVARPHAS